MKRERVSRVVLVLVGFLYLGWTYPLFESLWQSNWLPKHEDSFPMFMSVNAVLGVFLLRAVTEPSRHRSVIAFAAWSTLAHASTMAIMTAEAWSHGMHRKDSPQDIVIIGAIGLLLLAVLPAKQSAPARAERDVSALTSVQPNAAGT